MAVVPAVPLVPPCRVASRPRTAPGATFQRAPVRYRRLEPSESVKPAYGVTMPRVPGTPMPHRRSYEGEDTVFDPLHYLPLIERKIAALDQAAPLAGWELPDAFATLRRLMEARSGRAGRRGSDAARRHLEPAKAPRELGPGRDHAPQLAAHPGAGLDGGLRRRPSAGAAAAWETRSRRTGGVRAGDAGLAVPS